MALIDLDTIVTDEKSQTNPPSQSLRNEGMNSIDKSLLLVDDDVTFLRVLARAMGRQGFNVWPAQTLQEARSAIDAVKPDYAAIDFHLKDENGLDLFPYIQQHSPHTRAIILSGYATTSSAVAAVKLGAKDCLTKPVDADELRSCLMSTRHLQPTPPQTVMDPSQAKIKHILSHWEKNDRNTTKTAEILGMHRRSLQRILVRAGMGRHFGRDEPTPKPWVKLRRLYRVWARECTSR